MTQTLVPGKSTINDAVEHYGVTTHRVLAVLAESLTDVYTPEGDGGVVAEYGRRWALVNGAMGTERHEASSLALGRDSVAVLARYLKAPK